MHQATADKALIESRGSFELARLRQSFIFDSSTGRPLNPHGRTGMCNRGVLGKWGANFAADPIVTRYNPTKPGKPLEMVAIKRKALQRPQEAGTQTTAYVTAFERGGSSCARKGHVFDTMYAAGEAGRRSLFRMLMSFCFHAGHRRMGDSGWHG